MDPSITSREEVARQLRISTRSLLRFEGRGLVSPVHHGNVEGYGPAEVRRIWTIVTFRRDLGINLAGIEVILRFRDQMAATQTELRRLAERLEETLAERNADEAGSAFHE
jgi:MerR family transcriptional regulator/heat shock protein HspR